MPYRLHVVNLRAAAASRGDNSDYKIGKRTGVSKSGISRLVNLQVEPTVTTLQSFVRHYGGTLEHLIQDIELPSETS